tara:strand:- start:2482 stop:2754 length:273 start_codon:yes stop_codon:yes gene_type:complete
MTWLKFFVASEVEDDMEGGCDAFEELEVSSFREEEARMDRVVCFRCARGGCNVFCVRRALNETFAVVARQVSSVAVYRWDASRKSVTGQA